MRILITGASGLLGSNLAVELASTHQVFGVAHTARLKTEAFTVIYTDLLEPGAIERLVDRTQPEWVINCAALADLEACEKSPDLARRINSETPGILAEICRKGGACLLHVSTDAVFDGIKGSYSETDAPNPISVYAQTKLAGEYATAESHPEAIIARVNLFGFSPSGKRSLAEFFLNNLLARKPMKGFTDVFFCPLLANTIAHVFTQMLEKELSGLYHVFSADCLSKYEFGVRIARQFGLEETLISPSSVAESGLEASRAPNLTMDTHKLSTALGTSPPRISPMIEAFYTLYQQGYPQLIKGIVKGDLGNRT